MLGIIVLTVGRASETYIAYHIAGIDSSRTRVCALAPLAAPAWVPRAPVTELYRSDNAPLQLLRGVLSNVAPDVLTRVDNARLRSWLRRNHIRVVFCEYLQVAISVLDVCRDMRIPVIAHAHGYDVTAQPRQAGWKDLYLQQLPLIDEIVVVSHLMKREVLQFGVREQHVHVVPCGTYIGDTGTQTGPIGGEHRLLAVGRLIAKKGPLFLLEALRLLRQRGVGARLDIIGDGSFREPMHQFIRATKLEEHVRLLGELPNGEVRQRMREADVFLQHSITAENGDSEGLPVAIIEAMAESVPVVSTAHAGIPEVVKDGVTGFLVEPGDSDGMAARAATLLQDRNLRLRMGAAARQLIAQEYSLESELGRLRVVLARHWPEWIPDLEFHERHFTGPTTM
jgi:colanic acid/amylovoran biosynthesis glycosyltransferase